MKFFIYIFILLLVFNLVACQDECDPSVSLSCEQQRQQQHKINNDTDGNAHQTITTSQTHFSNATHNITTTTTKTISYHTTQHEEALPVLDHNTTIHLNNNSNIPVITHYHHYYNTSENDYIPGDVYASAPEAPPIIHAHQNHFHVHHFHHEGQHHYINHSHSHQTNPHIYTIKTIHLNHTDEIEADIQSDDYDEPVIIINDDDDTNNTITNTITNNTITNNNNNNNILIDVYHVNSIPIPYTIETISDDYSNQISSVGAPEMSDNVEVDMKNAIKSGNIDKISNYLIKCDDVPALAKGIRFDEEERSEALKTTTERKKDGDVVVLKGLAKAALKKPKKILKFVQVLVIAMTERKGYSRTEHRKLIDNLDKVFRNKKLLKKVMNSDPPPEMRRMLKITAATPIDSYYCAFCWEAVLCGQTVHWCPKIDDPELLNEENKVEVEVEVEEEKTKKKKKKRRGNWWRRKRKQQRKKKEQQEELKEKENEEEDKKLSSL